MSIFQKQLVFWKKTLFSNKINYIYKERNRVFSISGIISSYYTRNMKNTLFLQQGATYSHKHYPEPISAKQTKK